MPARNKPTIADELLDQLLDGMPKRRFTTALFSMI
jgi:hypothetical protein